MSHSSSSCSSPSPWLRFNLLLSTMRALGQASSSCSAFAVVGIRLTVAAISLDREALVSSNGELLLICKTGPQGSEAHRKYGGIGTLLVIKQSQFGELVADPVTNELLHYTEKPETFVSDRINCCVYVFTPDIFTAIRLRDVSSQRKDTAILRRVSSFEALQPATSMPI
ncbi:hypothetical protein Bca4012_092307 [Brassica carinata]